MHTATTPEYSGFHVFEDTQSPEAMLARVYLSGTSRDLGSAVLTELGHRLIDQPNNEYRYFGAWALLESAFPTYFSLDQSTESDPGNVDLMHDSGNVGFTTGALLESFRVFEGIERKTKHITEISDVRRIDDETIRQFDLSMRAGLVMGLKPFFLPKTTTPIKTYRGNGEIRTADAVTEEYSVRCKVLRKQINHLMGLQDQLLAANTDKKKWPGITFIQDMLRLALGSEAELRLIGSIWHAKSKNQAGGLIAVPAPIRLDLAFGHREPQADVVLSNPDSEKKLGIDMKRHRNQQGDNIPGLLIKSDGHFPVLKVSADKILRFSRAVRGRGVPPFEGFDEHQTIPIALAFANRIQEL